MSQMSSSCTNFIIAVQKIIAEFTSNSSSDLKLFKDVSVKFSHPESTPVYFAMPSDAIPVNDDQQNSEESTIFLALKPNHCEETINQSNLPLPPHLNFDKNALVYHLSTRQDPRDPSFVVVSIKVFQNHPKKSFIINASLRDILSCDTLKIKLSATLSINVYWRAIQHETCQLRVLNLRWIPTTNSFEKYFVTYKIVDHQSETLSSQETPLRQGQIISWDNLNPIKFCASFENLFQMRIQFRFHSIGANSKLSLIGKPIQFPIFHPLKKENEWMFHENIAQLMRRGGSFETFVFGFLDGIIQLSNLPEYAQCRDQMIQINSENASLDNKGLILSIPQSNIHSSLVHQIPSIPKVNHSTSFPSFLLTQNLAQSEDSFVYHPNFEEGILGCAVCSIDLGGLSSTYYEIQILELRETEHTSVFVGLTNTTPPLGHQLGQIPFSFALDLNGNFHFSNKKHVFCEKFKEKDIIGCGVSNNAIYFTKNNQFLGYAYLQDESLLNLIPAIQINSKMGTIRLNFGFRPYAFDPSQTTLPNGWTLCQNVHNQIIYFNSESEEFSIDGPQPKALPTWASYTLQHQNVLKSLIRPKANSSWRGIHSKCLIRALNLIPRAAFVHDSQRPIANTGATLAWKDNARTAIVQSTRIIANILDNLNLRQGKRFLDIGCNFGYATVLASQLVSGKNGEALGVDYCENFIESAKSNLLDAYRHLKLDFHCVNFKTSKLFAHATNPRPSSFTKGFDAVLCQYKMERSDLKFFERILNPNGRLVACLDSSFYLFEYDGDNWKEQVLISGRGVTVVDRPSLSEEEVEKEHTSVLFDQLQQEGRFGIETIREALSHFDGDIDLILTYAEIRSKIYPYQARISSLESEEVKNMSLMHQRNPGSDQTMEPFYNGSAGLMENGYR